MISKVIINPLHAVYNLLLSLSLAHKLIMFYTVTIQTCL